MKKICLRKNIETYNASYNNNKTFVENLHDFLKLNKLVKGRHYLEIDCGEYIAFCPFVYEILGSFRGFFPHCVTRERHYFDNYFKHDFYEYHNLKVFFLKKESFFQRMTLLENLLAGLKLTAFYIMTLKLERLKNI